VAGGKPLDLTMAFWRLSNGALDLAPKPACQIQCQLCSAIKNFSCLIA
jgi:hypothetical protein